MNARTTNATLVPDHILQLGMGFWASKTLLSAVELGLFTLLAEGPHDASRLAARLQLHPRSALDFFDALVALGMIERRGGLYSNTPESDLYLDRAKASYVGGLLEMGNARLYPFWSQLTPALRSGLPQNEAREGGDPFTAIYADPARLESFLSAMTGVSMGNAVEIARRFPWSAYRTFYDIGSAQGALPVQVALAHSHLRGGGFDLPATGPIFNEYIASHGLTERLEFRPGDFFADALPQADVLIMGHILHDWDLATKRMLLAKAFTALPRGGAVIVYDAIIDDERKQNAFGLLMSLNMLLETPGGFDYTGKQAQEWMREAGFRETRVEPLSGSYSMVVGIK